MSQSADDYKQAAQMLPLEYLGSLFSASGVDEAAVKAIHIKALFEDNKTMLGQAGGSIDGLQLRSGQALAKHFQDMAKRGTAHQKSNTDTLTWLVMLDNHISWLDKQIDNSEKDFAATDGEEWREKLALKILDKDAIPERKDGETMEAYRERLEQSLIDEMLDDEGNIKPEYKDDPEYGKYAEWAEWKFDRREAKALKAETSRPGISEAEKTTKITEFTKTASSERMYEARLQLKSDEKANDQLSEARNESVDQEVSTVSASSADNSFLG